LYETKISYKNKAVIEAFNDFTSWKKVEGKRRDT
jgi:hypothetical protein